MQSTHTSVKTTKEKQDDLAQKAQVLLQLKNKITAVMKELMMTNKDVCCMANEPWDDAKALSILQQLPHFNTKMISAFYTKGQFDLKKFVASQSYANLKELLQTQNKEYLALIQALSISDTNQSITVTLIIATMQELHHKNDKKSDHIAHLFNDELIRTLKTSLGTMTDTHHDGFCKYLDYKKNYTHIEFNIADLIDHEKEMILYAQHDFNIDTSEDLSKTSTLLDSVKNSFSQGADKCSNVIKVQAYLDFYQRMLKITKEVICKYELTHTLKASFKIYDEDLFNRLEILNNHTLLLKNSLGQSQALDQLIQNTCQSHQQFEKIFLERWSSVKSKLPNIAVDELEKTHDTLVERFAHQFSLMEETNQKLLKVLKYISHYSNLRDQLYRDLVVLRLALKNEMEKHGQSSELIRLYDTTFNLFENLNAEFPEKIPEWYDHSNLQATLEDDITKMSNRIGTLKDAVQATLEKLEIIKQQKAHTQQIQSKQKAPVKLKNKFHQKSPDNANSNPSITKIETTTTNTSSHSPADSLFNASISDQQGKLYPCTLYCQNKAVHRFLRHGLVIFRNDDESFDLDRLKK